MLDSLDKADLIRAREFLEFKSSRLHERIKLFIGGPDKIALLAIFGLVWLLYKELPAILAFKIRTIVSLDDYVQLFIWTVVAFSVAIVAGGVALCDRLRRYTYQSEILRIHLRNRV